MFQQFNYNSSDFLYYFTEIAHAAMIPSRLSSMLLLESLSKQYNPLYQTELVKTICASLEMFERITRQYKKPEFNIHEIVIDDVIYKIEQQAIITKPFCQLLHFAKKDFAKKQPKLLIVAPMAGHHATLLRATVQDTMPHFDIYITDWISANYVPLSAGKFDMDDFIDYVIEFIEFLKEDVHVMAVCQPTVPVLAAISIMSSMKNSHVPKSMILIGGPVDASKNPTVVNNFAMDRSIEWFEKTVISLVPFNYPGHLRPVYPGILQLIGFMNINLERHLLSHINMFKDLVAENDKEAQRQKTFYDEYLSVMDLPAEFYLQTIREVFQNFSLANNKLISRGRKVEPASITSCALLAIEGEKDDISGIGQTKAALELCTNLPEPKKKYYLQPGVGHYGVFSGSKFRNSIIPIIKDFIYNL